MCLHHSTHVRIVKYGCLFVRADAKSRGSAPHPVFSAGCGGFALAPPVRSYLWSTGVPGSKYHPTAILPVALGNLLEYCNVLSRKRDSFALALPNTSRASEQYGTVTCALRAEARSDWRSYANAYDAEHFTVWAVSHTNPQCSVLNRQRTVIHQRTGFVSYA